MVMSQAMQVLTSRATDEWYTPPGVIELVRAVLGQIDLDPASNTLPQTWIQAAKFYNADEDGLRKVWHGRVWLNPPYGMGPDGSNQAVWSKLMALQYRQSWFDEGILLINSTHGYRWYEDMWTMYPVCCARERIRFIKSDGTQGGQAKRGQTFVYFGKNVERFSEVFSTIGRVILPEVLPQDNL